MHRRTLLAAAATAAAIPAALPAWAQAPEDPQNTLYMDLKDGRVVIRLRPDLAPKMVERVKQLTREGFYNGTPFHRVIDGFMAQGGDPTGTGRGGSKYPDVKGEFSNTAHFLRGTVGAARSSSPDSANSQFFICLAPAPFLDTKYTVFGQVVSGMDVVDKIKKGSSSDNGAISGAPDKIIRMQVAADAK